MFVKKFTVSNDPTLYEAWPDVALTPGGKLICVFAECTHHGNRDYTRVMLAESSDRGRSWSPKRPLTEGTRGLSWYYNCPRISCLRDGRLAIVVDKVAPQSNERGAGNLLYFSDDEGATWGQAADLPIFGIVPDKLLELASGRWIVGAHRLHEGKLAQFLIYSDDRGESWSKEIRMAADPRWNLCEVSILDCGNHTLVGFMRENSALGYDCKKVISQDDGESWGEIIDFPIPGCHRPVAGFLQDGRILLTCRFMQGGKGWLGSWTQNFLGSLFDRKSALAETRSESAVRIFPIDYDRSPLADLGYSGFVQFSDGEVYIVNYIVDDAYDKAQIRGYSLNVNDLLISKHN